jgi:hypothetical protein
MTHENKDSVRAGKALQQRISSSAGDNVEKFCEAKV